MTESDDGHDPHGPRPYAQTGWEALGEGKHEHAIDALARASQDIADHTAAVQKITKESLIADNKRYRRGNNLLLTLVAGLILAVGVLLYRDIFINEPQRQATARIAEELEECTTPGARAPTADDPSTGHPCFDEAQERTAKAVAAIVDADGNGKVDTQEILEYLHQFDVFLNLADEAATP